MGGEGWVGWGAAGEIIVVPSPALNCNLGLHHFSRVYSLRLRRLPQNGALAMRTLDPGSFDVTAEVRGCSIFVGGSVTERGKQGSVECLGSTC